MLKSRCSMEQSEQEKIELLCLRWLLLFCWTRRFIVHSCCITCHFWTCASHAVDWLIKHMISCRVDKWTIADWSSYKIQLFIWKQTSFLKQLDGYADAIHVEHQFNEHNRWRWQIFQFNVIIRRLLIELISISSIYENVVCLMKALSMILNISSAVSCGHKPIIIISPLIDFINSSTLMPELISLPSLLLDGQARLMLWICCDNKRASQSWAKSMKPFPLPRALSSAPWRWQWLA